MSSLVPSAVALGLVAFAALQLTLGRPCAVELTAERAAASRMLALAAVIQATHFLEEWATGFHLRFPALFGFEPMPVSAFVGFNVTWIVLWIVSIPPLRAARQPAFFAAWFLAIAGMLNGIAHPVLAAWTGGYFPGLITSPLTGSAGLFLWRRLRGATSSSNARR